MVNSPYNLYNTQKDYVNDVVHFLEDEINKRDNTLIPTTSNKFENSEPIKYILQEGPTGMGKTVVNLMGALYWIERKGGRVVYFSREHAQIRQCLEDLKKLEQVNPHIPIRAVHIAGTSHACLVDEVKNCKDYDEQQVLCDTYDQHICDYSTMLQTADGGKVSSKYILSLKPEHTDYYYNFDLSFGDSILTTLDKDVHVNEVYFQTIVNELFEESIVSIDTIMKVAKKYTVCPKKLESLAMESANIIFAPYQYMVYSKIKIRNPDGSPTADWFYIIDEAHNLDQNLTDMISFSITEKRINEFLNAINRPPYNNEEQLLVSADTIIRYIDNYIINGTKKEYIGDDLEQVLKNIDVNSFATFQTHVRARVERNMRTRVFSNSIPQHARVKIPRSFLSMNNFLENLNLLMRFPLRGLIKISNDKTQILIQFVDVAEIFESSTSAPLKVAITSGSLYPSYMARYLGIEHKCLMYAYKPPHTNLANIGKIITSIDGVKLGTRYKDRGAKQFNALANAICHIHKEADEGGTLVFFPSYSFRDAIKSILSSRHAKKIYSPDTVEEFRKSVKNGDQPIFMTAFRGLGNEGWNFPDDESRTIILCGIPYLPYNDAVVKTQKDYYEKKQRGLGQTWYEQKAVLWLLQAFGRGIRHKDDWTKVYFLDPFIGSKRRYFVKWVADSINWIPETITSEGGVHRG